MYNVDNYKDKDPGGEVTYTEQIEKARQVAAAEYRAEDSDPTDDQLWNEYRSLRRRVRWEWEADPDFERFDRVERELLRRDLIPYIVYCA